ncbi:unnamed protein product [Phaeothamnion confervicola]
MIQANTLARLLRQSAARKLVPRSAYFSARRCLAEADENLSEVTDFSAPHLWYPNARRLKRRLVCHAGPTNSGKTHAALAALRNAADGVYCGPLRLLAWEVYEQLNADGVPCSLVTDIRRGGD